jgi:regulator of protease activity HflC (stomatin/prohibitin superfamily)
LPFSMLSCCGFFSVPEKTHVSVLYFGKYVGSIQEPGIHCLPPIGAEFRYLSTATRTINMEDIKVLDSRGNPVIISAVVTFEPTSAKKACIDVEDPWPNPGTRATGTFLQVQAKAVLKRVTSMFPYEAPPGEPSLQTEGTHIAEMLISRLQRRVSLAGARILSFDLVDLSYAPEIDSSMLVRQQASALVDARKLIVEAAVDMTYQAVQDLEKKTGKPMSDEMRERTCSNLLTVVCSGEAVTPTLNVGR